MKVSDFLSFASECRIYELFYLTLQNKAFIDETSSVNSYYNGCASAGSSWLEHWLTFFNSEHQYYLWLNLELEGVRIYSGTDRIGSESLMFRSNYRILKKSEGTKFYPLLKSFLQFHCCNNFSTFCIQTNQFLKFYRSLRPLSKYLQFHLRFSF